MTASTLTTAAIVTDRARGALYGVALGDAMGMPGELWSRAKVVDTFGWIDRFLDAPEGHPIVDGWVAGQVTDDTQQMVMLAESIINAGGTVDVRTLARDLVAWADRVGATEGRFLGPTSARVIHALREGADPLDTGVAGLTNGAAMRIAPVGVLCPSDDLEKLVDQVEATCVIAHLTNIAIAGAAMIAAVVSTGIDAPEGQSRDETVAAAIDAAYRACAIGMTRGKDEAAASLLRRTELAVEAARSDRSDDDFLQYVYDVVGANTDTTESVPAALGLVVRANGDPVRVAVLSANLGGDTDTVGAMAGGMCGAIAGYSAIPEEMSEQLVRVNELDIEPVIAKLVGYRQAAVSSRRAVTA
ncbi:ADP-ribosylglycohydrolase family protein [Microbacterium sp. NPDC055357]